MMHYTFTTTVRALDDESALQEFSALALSGEILLFSELCSDLHPPM